MDEKIKDQEVLLVKDQKDESLRAVTGADEKGGLKTVLPTAEHEQNFLSNFMRQFKYFSQPVIFKSANSIADYQVWRGNFFLRKPADYPLAQILCLWRGYTK